MKRAIQAVLGLFIGLFLLWLVFRDTDWAEVGGAMREIHWGWLLASQIPLMASFFLRVKRWTYIVRATESASFRHMFAATQIGFLGNFTLPARLGEVIRAVVLTRLTAIPVSKSVALVAMDRVTDLFGLIAALAISVVAFQPKGDVVIPAATFGTENDQIIPASMYQTGAWGAAIVVVVVVAGFVVLYLNRNLVLAIIDKTVGLLFKGLAERIKAMFNLFADSLHVFRSPLDLLKAIGFSLLTWLACIIAAGALLEAFHLDCPWYTPFVMQALLAFGISVPGPPGLVGQFHAPIIVALVMVMPGVDLSVAKAFAIVAHLNNFPGLILTAGYSLVTENLGLVQLGKEGAQLATEVDRREDAPGVREGD